jgi:hypothetical protein
MSNFETISLTMLLQTPFTALMALLVIRVCQVYGGVALRDLAIGWSLWTGRMMVASVAAVLQQSGMPPHGWPSIRSPGVLP